MTAGGVSPVPYEARPYQGHRAGLVTRTAAAVIDALVVAAAISLAYLGLAGVTFALDPRGFSWPTPSVLFNFFFGFAVTVGYLTLAWWATGRTIGCAVMGLRVVGFRGRNPGLLTSLVRAVFYALLPIGLAWCAISRENRSVQDLVLRTSVIYDWQHRPRAS